MDRWWKEKEYVNGQSDASIAGRANAVFMEVSALLRQKEKQQRVNCQSHSLYQFCIWGRQRPS